LRGDINVLLFKIMKRFILCIMLECAMKLYLTSVASEMLDKIDFEGKTNVAFIPTAAEPYEDKWFVEKDKKALIDAGLDVTVVDLVGKTQEQVSKELAEFEIIFVAGGNTFYLLEMMNRCGFKDVLKKLLLQGVIYVGSSAGSIVLCPDIDYVKELDDASKTKLDSSNGLGFVDFYVLPHYDKEKYSSKCEAILDQYKNLNIIPISDSQMIVVDDLGYEVV